MLSVVIRYVNLILEVRTMKEFTAEDAYYYYMLILTGYRKELETLVIDAVNSDGPVDPYIMDLYMELDNERELMSLLRKKFDIYLSSSSVRTRSKLYGAYSRILAFFRERYANKELSAEMIAEKLGQIASEGGCYAFSAVEECYSRVEDGILPSYGFVDAMRTFLETGKFAFGGFNVDLNEDKEDPNKELNEGRKRKPSMGTIHDRMLEAFGDDIRLTLCWGPVQMCVYEIGYTYVPKDYSIVWECDRGILAVTVKNKEGKRFWPSMIYPEAEYYHYEDVKKDVAQLLDLLIRAIKNDEIVFK